ncbi:hypothetical protein JW978_00520 [Candidatus Dojkabacteria bacterium]|nr:hypothetical protein [Candidatus Dojkabacteria bacterium]
MNKTITIILIIVALALGAGAIYFGYQLTQEETPTETTEDTSVAGQCNAGCGWCVETQDCNKCCTGGDWADGRCDTTDEWMAGWSQCQGTTSCYATVSGDVTSFSLSSGCTSSVKIKKFRRAYTGTSHTFYPDCITDASNGTNYANEDGQAGATYRAYSPGYCVQIDADGGGVNTGVCRCVPAEPKCGDGKINQTSEQCEVGIPCTGTYAGKKCNTTTCLCKTVTTQATCGDGEINQDDEECEVGVDCEEGFTCNTRTCLCEEVLETCGDGTLDPGEYCDYAANPTGCLSGETCTTTCRCEAYIPVDGGLPKTAIIDDKTDELLYAALAIVGGLFLLQFNIKGFVIDMYERTKQARENRAIRKRENFEQKVGK